MIKKIFLVIVAMISLLLIYAGLKSPDYTVMRQITVNAPAEKVFPYLNNMKLADQWGPWKEIDPTVSMVLSGPEEGIGAKTSWAGARQMGTGSATIVESTAGSKVKILLEYTEPMAMVQNSEYLLEGTGDQSTVTWQVTGQNNFIGRVMGVFINVDQMVGGMFEKGLSNLKTLLEKA